MGPEVWRGRGDRAFFDDSRESMLSFNTDLAVVQGTQHRAGSGEALVPNPDSATAFLFDPGNVA